MKTLKKQMWAKAAAAIICFAALCCLIAEALCAVFLCGMGAYAKSDEEFMSDIYDKVAYDYARLRLSELALDSPENVLGLEADGSEGYCIDMITYINWGMASFFDPDLCKIRITRDDGAELLSQPGKEGKALYDGSYRMPVYYRAFAADTVGDQLPEEQNKEYTVEITLIEPKAPGDLAGIVLLLCRFGLRIKYSVYLFILAALLIVALMWTFLCSAAGHSKQSEGIRLRFPARVPLDLEITIIVVLLVLAGLLCVAVMEETAFAWPLGVALCLLTALLTVAAVEWLPVSFAARVKAGKWWRNTLIYMFLHLLWRVLRSAYRGAVSLIRKLPFIWRTALFAAVILSVNFILSALDSLFLVLMIDLIIFAAIIWYAVSVEELKKCASGIAQGSLGSKADTTFMPHELKLLGRDLGSMGDGLTRAVEEKMKSERMKTELITNVSHDIKTPLTSIVNYVELLGRESLEGKAAEYVEVLSRQSQRMKKLIDDLVEASKASTGNITADLAPFDLSVMAGQTEGEYAERFASQGLQLVVSGADSPAVVRADGRLVWRIWDNLLGNICKYALPGTRVYLNIERRGDMIATVFRNISEQPLCKPAKELTERFVRGDNSRSGEGSGLGLSIASGLAAVQGGTLSVTADGDLFKAEVCLPAMPAEDMTGEKDQINIVRA